jgi:hypothetical protein
MMESASILMTCREKEKRRCLVIEELKERPQWYRPEAVVVAPGNYMCEYRLLKIQEVEEGLTIKIQ